MCGYLRETGRNTALYRNTGTQHIVTTQEHCTVAIQENSTLSLHQNTADCHNTGTQHCFATPEHNTLS